MGSTRPPRSLDEYTAKVTFDKPLASFLDAAAQVYLGMASPTAFKKWGPADYQAHQIGTGPFMFSEKDYIPKEQVVIVKNPDYNWGPDLQAHRPAVPRQGHVQLLPRRRHPFPGPRIRWRGRDRRTAAHRR